MSRVIRFYNLDGKFVGKAPVLEAGSRGNKHVNLRRPDGPTCGGELVGGARCELPWQSVCSSTACTGNREPRRVTRVEKWGLRPQPSRKGFGSDAPRRPRGER